MDHITAQDFYDYDKCPHRVYLNHNGHPAEKLPYSDFLNLLFERALLHESEVVEDLPSQMPQGETLDQLAQSTTALMESGVERIYQGVLVSSQKTGRPDLLERETGKSKFGDYFYKPVDIKSGSGFENEDEGTLREDYGMQLYHYAKLLEQIQGAFPPEGQILNKRKVRVRYLLSQFTAAYNSAFPVVADLISRKVTDEPALASVCAQCQWWGHCEKILVQNNDVTLLPDVGRSKKVGLNNAGVKAIQDIPTFDFRKVKIKGIGDKTVDKIKRAARAVLAAKMEILNRPTLPDNALKIYFDFEDDPTQELIYLTGLWAQPAIRGRNYHGLMCCNEAGEAQMWADFQGFCAEIKNQDYVVFHYSPYEKTKLDKLDDRHGTSEKDAVDLFRARMVDLLPVVKASVVLPTRGYGLKKIVPIVGFKYETEDPGGAQAIVWFQEYQKDPSNKQILDKILKYNEEDCVALKAVYEWLRKL